MPNINLDHYTLYCNEIFCSDRQKIHVIEVIFLIKSKEFFFQVLLQLHKPDYNSSLLLNIQCLIISTHPNDFSSDNEQVYRLLSLNRLNYCDFLTVVSLLVLIVTCDFQLFVTGPFINILLAWFVSSD